MMFALLFSTQTFARSFECGVYSIEGTVRMIKGSPTLIINEKTKSELTLSAPLQVGIRLAAYIDQPVSGQIVITKKMDGTRGTIAKINDVKDRAPDPLHKFEEKFDVIKTMECK